MFTIKVSYGFIVFQNIITKRISKYFSTKLSHVLAHIFRGQVASLMLRDRTKKKMTFVGLEPTPPAIRAVVLTN